MKKTRKFVNVPNDGERALIVGSTGSGKTAFACFLLQHLETVPIVIYDTKEENKFDALENSVEVNDHAGCIAALEDEEIDYVIYRPSLDVTSDPEALDSLLLTHYNEFRKVGCYIDEVYQFHKNGKCGQGLIGLLTRGRSRGITTIISTQRPSYLSRFCLTEAQKFYVFKLIDMQDKKRMGDIIPEFSKESDPVKHGFWFYESGKDFPEKFNPIKLDKSLETGYIPEPSDDHDIENIPIINNINKLIWL